MEVTINYNGQAVAVEVTLEVYEFLDRADHKTENLFHEQRRHWDGREFDEYIITTEGVGVYGETPEEYYPFCKEDIFVEVSDEIVEAFLLDKRAEAARDRKMFRYKAFYSLDCNDGIENAAIGWAQPSPKDHLIEKEELAEYEELIRRLYEAISSLPPMQARRVHARYMLSMKVKDIAAMEGITPSQAGKSIHAALRRLRRYFARQKWTVNL